MRFFTDQNGRNFVLPTETSQMYAEAGYITSPLQRVSVYALKTPWYMNPATVYANVRSYLDARIQNPPSPYIFE